MTVAEAAAAYGIRLRPATLGDNLIRLTRRIYGDDAIRYRLILIHLNRRLDWYNLTPGETIYYIDPSFINQIDSFMTFDDIVVGDSVAMWELAIQNDVPPTVVTFTYAFNWIDFICQKEPGKPARNTGNSIAKRLTLTTYVNESKLTEETFIFTNAFLSYPAIPDAVYMEMSNAEIEMRGAAFISFLASQRSIDVYSISNTILVSDLLKCPLPPIIIVETIQFLDYTCQTGNTQKAYAETVIYKKYIDDVLTTTIQKSLLLDINPVMTLEQYQAQSATQAQDRGAVAVQSFNPVTTPQYISSVVIDQVSCAPITGAFVWGGNKNCQVAYGSNTGYELFTTLSGTITQHGNTIATTSNSVLDAFGTYSAITATQWAELSTADINTRANALITYAIAQSGYILNNYTISNSIINHNEVDCTITNIYIFSFDDGSAVQNHSLAYDEGFTDTIISTKNGEFTNYTVLDKPDWATVTLNGNVATFTGQNTGEYRQGTITYQQSESGATIISNIEQFGIFIPTEFILGIGKWTDPASSYYPGGPPEDYSVGYLYQITVDGSPYTSGVIELSLGDTESIYSIPISITGNNQRATIGITLSAPYALWPDYTIDSIQYGDLSTYQVIPGYITLLNVQTNSVTIEVDDKGGKPLLGSFIINPIIQATLAIPRDYELEWLQRVCQQEAATSYTPLHIWSKLVDYNADVQEPTNTTINLGTAEYMNYASLAMRVFDSYELSGETTDATACTPIPQPASNSEYNLWWQRYNSASIDKGRFNSIGISGSMSSWDYTLPLVITRSGDYYIYAAADNFFSIYIDDVLILKRDASTQADSSDGPGWAGSDGYSRHYNFTRINLWKVTLTEGIHELRITGGNDGLDMGVAVEIYDISALELIASLTPKGESYEDTAKYMDPRIVFSTEPYRTGVTAVTCASGWSLAYTDEGLPICTQGSVPLYTGWAIRSAFIKVNDRGQAVDRNDDPVINSGLRPAIAIVDILYPSYSAGDYIRIDNVEYQIVEIIQAPDLNNWSHDQIFHWNGYECIMWKGI